MKPAGCHLPVDYNNITNIHVLRFHIFLNHQQSIVFGQVMELVLLADLKNVFDQFRRYFDLLDQLLWQMLVQFEVVLLVVGLLFVEFQVIDDWLPVKLMLKYSGTEQQLEQLDRFIIKCCVTLIAHILLYLLLIHS